MSSLSSGRSVKAMLSRRNVDHWYQSRSASKVQSPGAQATPLVTMDGKPMPVVTAWLPEGRRALSSVSNCVLPVGSWVKVAAPV